MEQALQNCDALLHDSHIKGNAPVNTGANACIAAMRKKVTDQM